MRVRTSSIAGLLILSFAFVSSGGAQDNGTDPSAFAKRTYVYNDYNQLGNDVHVNVTYFDLYFPAMKDANEIERFLLKVEMPFVNAQHNLGVLLPPAEASEAPPAVSGVGDILFRFFSVPWYNESRDFKLLAGVDLYVPSAQGALLFSPQSNRFSELQLGTGKYRLAPSLGFVWAVKPNFLIVPLYFQDFSVAGDPSRPAIDFGKFRFFMMYAWPNRVYVLPETQVVTNYHLHHHTEVFFRPEVGYVLNKDGTTFYVKPGFDVTNSGPLDRKWGLESGFRFRF